MQSQSFTAITIGVCGLWHLGEVFAAGLASLGHRVIAFDEDKAVIAKLKRGIPPLEEPGLRELIRRESRRGNLVFTHTLADLKLCDVVWVTFDTPVDNQDRITLEPIIRFLKRAVPFFKRDAWLIFSSQIPIGSSAILQKAIKRFVPGVSFRLAYVPENLQLGRALESFFNPGRVVIGAEEEITRTHVQKLLAPLKTNFLPMSLASAELSKHALNAFLATSLSFIYDIADVAERHGADVTDVAKALRSDARIGPAAYLDASIGFSGGTLARDLQVLVSKRAGSRAVLPVITAVIKKNKERRRLVVNKLKRQLGSLRGKHLAILGLTYKPGTPTLRRALALEVIAELRRQGARLHLHDPLAHPGDVKNFTRAPFYRDPYRAARGCQAAVIITNCPEFKKIHFHKFRECLKAPYVFFDTRNFFHDQRQTLERQGFTYIGVGC